MTSGRTSPALCGCEDASGAPVFEYVVKLRGSIQHRGLFNELIGAKLASHFGISSPSPALILLEPTLVDLIASRESAKGGIIRRSIGLNFGTQVLIGFSTWPVDKQLPEVMRGAAADIFAFDALIQNPDRRYNNPNLLTSGDAIMVIDHDLAFSFILDILPSSSPWALDRQGYLADHVFYRQLNSKAIDISGFIARLNELSGGVLDDIFADVPPEWNNEDALKIRQHIDAVRDHAAEFAEQIRRFLA
jgi:hypothetical protein